MIRTNYDPDFERLWLTFEPEYGQKGSKKKALEAYKKKKIDYKDVDMIIERYRAQLEVKKMQAASGQFWSQFPHVERYIKHERWDDEITFTHPVNNRRLTKSELADKALFDYLRAQQ